MPIKTMFYNSKASEVKATNIDKFENICFIIQINIAKLIYEVKIYVVFFEGLYYNLISNV